MAALAYSIQSPVRSFTNPSSKIKLCRSYGCSAIAPKPAEEKGLLWGSRSSFVPKSSNLGFGLHASSMGFRKCSFSSPVKGGVGDFVGVTKDCVKGGDGAFVRAIKTFIFVGAMLAIATFAAKMSASHAWRRAVFIGAFIAIFARAIFESRHIQQVSLPFSLGDTIKVGSLEGKVVEMGLNTTTLLSAGRYRIEFQNSLLSSLVDVQDHREYPSKYEFHNHSRAHGRRIVTTNRFPIDDFAKVPLILDDIKKMLSSNPMIFFTHCYVSKIEGGDLVFTLECTLKESKSQFYSAEQDILLQVNDLIKRHAATII